MKSPAGANKQKNKGNGTRWVKNKEGVKGMTVQEQGFGYHNCKYWYVL